MLDQLMRVMCEVIALNGAGNAATALEQVDKGLMLQPDFLPLLMQRAQLLEQTGSHAGAVQAYEDCLAHHPTFADAQTGLRRALTGWIRQCDAAMLGRDPSDCLDLLIDKAHALRKSGRFAEALVAIDPVSASRPMDRVSLNLRADVLLQLGRYEDALECYDRAVLFHDVDAVLLYNRANVLMRMHHLAEALQCYDDALSLAPDFAEARVARSHVLLMAGRFEDGWRDHEARRAIAQLRRADIQSRQPQWRAGEDVGGKTVLLWAEQGLGDSLQFARYIPQVVALAGQVIVCVPPALEPLLRPSFPACTFITNDKVLPPHDLHCPLMSLPLVLGCADPAQDAAEAYLAPEPALAHAWSRQLQLALGAEGRPRVGLVWAGRQYGTVNHTRDIALSFLVPLFDLPVEMVSLQLDIPEPDLSQPCLSSLHALPLTDWADTAALVSQLDLVICVDTSVAHLAGALGKPAFLMLRKESEWRWGLELDRTAWYPSMRLFRQQERGDWAGVVAEVKMACESLFATRDSSPEALRA